MLTALFGGKRHPPPEAAAGEGRACPICLEETKNEVRLPCGHTFCRSCVTTWLPNLNCARGCCPICREDVDREKIDFPTSDSVPNDIPFQAFVGYWNIVPRKMCTKKGIVFDALVSSLPDKTQFELRRANELTQNVRIIAKWTQLNPLKRPATRRALADKAARLDVKWVSLVIDYDPTEEINSVGLATADDEEGKNETVLFDKKVIDPLHVIVKELLTESDVPFLIDHNVSLRRFHRGFEISVYDARPYIEHQVFFFKV